MYYHTMSGHDLGKFSFKRLTTKVVKFSSGYTFAKPLVKVGGKVLHKVGKVAGKVIGVAAGGLGPSQDMAPLDGGIERGSESGDSGLPFGLSPLMLGLLIGVPVVLFMVSKKS